MFKSGELPGISRILTVILMFAALGLTACGGSDDDDDANLRSFLVSLDGEQEVPTGVSTDATGTAGLTLDLDTREISGSIATSNLSGAISAAHIHDGFAGTNGSPIVTLTVTSGSAASIPDGTILSQENFDKLLAGGLYLNVHTATNAAGEIRGQILPAGITMMRTTLVGEQEVPTAVTTSTTGIGYVTVNESTGDVVINTRTFDIDADNVNRTVTNAHLHLGFAGTSGGPIVQLAVNAGDTLGDSVVWDGTSTLSADNLAALLAGGTYLNVHSGDNPAGEIRGQVLPEGFSVMRTAMTGAQEVPNPVTTSTTGIGYVTVNESTGDVVINTRTFGIDTDNVNRTVTNAHLHLGFAGTSGGPIVQLAVNAGDTAGSSVVWDGTATLNADNLAALLAGGTYLNVHSSDNAGGEIRGQVAPSNITVFRTTMDGDEEVPPVTTSTTGIGYVTVNTTTGAVVINTRTFGIDTDNASRTVSNAHLHLGAVGATGGPIVQLGLNAGDTAGGSVVWDGTETLNADNLAALLAGGTYLNVHSNDNGSGEIRGQVDTADVIAALDVGAGPGITMLAAAPKMLPVAAIKDPFAYVCRSPSTVTAGAKAEESAPQRVEPLAWRIDTRTMQPLL